MHCSNCQRPLPDTLVCEYCTSPEDEELLLAPEEKVTPGIASDVMRGTGGVGSSVDLAEAQEVHLQPVEQSTGHRCRKCQTEIPIGKLQCPVCAYNPQLSRQFDPLELDEFDGAMGFQRFLMKHTSNNDPSNLVLWLRIFLVFVLAVYIVTARDLTSMILSVFIIGGYVGYVAIYGTEVRFHEGRSIVPRVVLLSNRLSGWQGIAKSPKNDGAVITKRGGSFGDEQLALIDKIEALEILDIPGTQITDMGIAYLQSFPNLKAVVVQECKVSSNALDALQKYNRAVMIWR